jgi:hypothetical protein
MEIRLRSTGQVMYESELRAYLFANNGPSYAQLNPEVMEALNVDPVFEGPQAQPTRYQTAFRDGVTQDDQGRWFTKYSVADMDAEAIAAKDAGQAASVRSQRTEKLKDSDWTQVADAPVDKAVWATYRQALRDVTAQSGFPWDITWPSAP